MIHHAGAIKYVGKTDAPTMSYGTRLRREFAESTSSRRHNYPKLVLLAPILQIPSGSCPSVQVSAQLTKNCCHSGSTTGDGALFREGPVVPTQGSRFRR
jgi:hypothetical protein